MPNASPSSGRDTSRASRRVLDAAHAVQAALQANNKKLQASIECRQFECQFAEFYSNWPRDKEYYALLTECRQTRLALRQATPSSTYTFLDVLTATLIWCTTHAEGLAYEDEHKFKSCSSPSLSPHTNACSSDSTRLEAVQTSHKGPRNAPSLVNDRKSYEDEHTESRSSPPLSSRAASGLPDSMHPEAIHLGHQVPAQLVEVPRDASPSMASLHPDVKSLRRVPVTSPPVHGEVPSLVTKQMLEGEAVSKEEETRADTCSPMPSAALSLPERTPILSMRAISSRQGRNKSQPPRSTLATPGRHGSTNVVNQGTAATVHRPGVSLPFQSGHRSSAPKIPPDQVEVLSSMKRSISDTVVSSEQTSTAMCSPLSPAIHLLPKLPPAIAAQDVLH
ncbi:hypothetical protein AX14_007852 [Amanita brunnescens Koide BX004]|nr:hypothetical protein AX14_007852 [Amanita brunnescens Koide BX004]